MDRPLFEEFLLSPIRIWHNEFCVESMWEMYIKDEECKKEENKENEEEESLLGLDFFIETWDSLFLAENFRMLIFDSIDTLYEYVKSAKEVNLERYPDFMRLRSSSRENKWKNPGHLHVCDFFYTGKLFKEFDWKNWNERKVHSIYIDLDMLMDMMITIKDKKVFPLYMGVEPEEQSPPIGFLTNELMGYNPDKGDELIRLNGKFEIEQVYPLYANAIGRVLLRTKMIMEGERNGEKS